MNKRNRRVEKLGFGNYFLRVPEIRWFDDQMLMSCNGLNSVSGGAELALQRRDTGQDMPECEFCSVLSPQVCKLHRP